MYIPESIKQAIKNRLPVRHLQPPRLLDDNISGLIFTLSMQRSGQHAVINWLCSQIGRVIHFNHCVFLRQNTTYYIRPTNNRVILYDGQTKQDSHIQTYESMLIQLNQIKNTNTSLLYSFEDICPQNRMLANFINRKSPMVIIIVRDPFNWLASTLKHKQYTTQELIKKKSIYISYLNTILDSAHRTKSHIVPIIFNQWATSIEYRRSLCESIDIPFTDIADQSVSEIPDFGGGSSFDGTDATQVKANIFNRWEDYIHDDTFNTILDDSNLKKLALQCFDLDDFNYPPWGI